MFRERDHKGEDGRGLPPTFVKSLLLPLEGMTMLGNLMVTMMRRKRGKPLQMQLFDISRAHFREMAQRESLRGLARRGAGWREWWSSGEIDVLNAGRVSIVAGRLHESA